MIAVLIVAVAVAAWGASTRIRPVTAAGDGAGGLEPVTRDRRAPPRRRAGKVTYRAMLGISWFWLAGAMYLSQFPSFVRFCHRRRGGGGDAILGGLLGRHRRRVAPLNRVLRGKVSSKTVPWGALGMGVLSIDLCLASPPGGAARR